MPVFIVDTVDIDGAEGEADVDNDEDEEEDKDVHHHVAHGDDDGSDLAVHQANLGERKRINPLQRVCAQKSSRLNRPQECDGIEYKAFLRTHNCLYLRHLDEWTSTKDCRKN